MKNLVLFLLLPVIVILLVRNHIPHEEPMKPQKLDLGKKILSPTLIYPGTEWFDWDQISLPNRFACNGVKGFGFAEIDTLLSITYTPVKAGFPGRGTTFNASDDGSIMWGKEGYRALWALDVESGKTIDGDVFVNDGSSEIYEGWQYGQGKLLVQTSFPRNDYSLTSSTRAFYDIPNKKIERLEDDYDNPRTKAHEYLQIIPFKENLFISRNSANWHYTKLDSTGFEGFYENALTKKMTEENFNPSYWTRNYDSWSISKRYIFGSKKIKYNTPAVVRWDEAMEDVTVTFIHTHFPDSMYYVKAWSVSPNGEWARCLVKSRDYSNKSYYTCFFHLDDKYPNGVSLGVLGESSLQMHGIFVEHDELGTLYLDNPEVEGFNTESKYPGAVLLYKMSDFFPALEEVIKEKTEL